MLLYVIAFLDRVNVNIAALEMKQDLGFTDAVYGFGAGIFFVGYFLFEIPGTLLVENWSARGWIARIMITWGILAAGMGFIHTDKQFYWVRFFLGVGEAGFFPGVIVYLSHWFRYQDRAKAVALFMAAIPLSSVIGSPISGFLLGIHWLGMAGWRWLFVLEGLPAIIFGVVTIFYLTDWPREAKWLPEEERLWITAELEREKQARSAAHSYRIWEALKDREVVLLALAYFFVVTSTYGFNFWFPTLVKNLSGFSDFKVSLIVSLTYCVTLLLMLIMGWSSDRTGERRFHAALPITLGAVGFLLSAISLNNPVLAILTLCCTGAILYSYLPGFWPLPSSFLTGSAAAAAIGLINSIGNLGGFVGGYILGYVRTKTNSFAGGLLYLSLSALLSVGMILALRQKKTKVDVVLEA
jgi:sugar phosphate permease